MVREKQNQIHVKCKEREAEEKEDGELCRMDEDNRHYRCTEEKNSLKKGNSGTVGAKKDFTMLETGLKLEGTVHFSEERTQGKSMFHHATLKLVPS